MHPDFWLERWRNNQIGFHEPAANPLLVAHFATLEMAPASRMFLPLCGKTLDIDWLLARGHRVAGVELSRLAVEQVFERLGQRPQVSTVGALECHGMPGLAIYLGDMMALREEDLGEVDAVYDRAALIALPPAMRADYAAHLTRITRGAAQLLVTLDYDQSRLDGPPFAVPASEVQQLYADRNPRLLARHDVAGGIKGRCAGSEEVWLVGPAPQSRNFATLNPR